MTDISSSRAPTAEHKKLTPAAERAKGLEPTRYGDWEHNGIASDF